MSLSTHEKIQFELLTADLALDDSGLKKMAKRDRATAMSYVALPSTSMILMVAAAIGLIFVIVGGLTHNISFVICGGVSSLLALTTTLFTSLREAAAMDRKTRTVE